MPSFTPAARAEVVMLVGQPYDATVQTDLLDWPLPCGDVGLPTENQFSLLGGQTTVRAATEGFTTAPAHTPADTYVGPYLAQPFNYVVELFAGTEPTGQQGSAGIGIIRLDDPDGALDGWLDYAWDGRQIDLYRGVRGTDPAGWTRVASVTADALLHDLRGKQLRMRDLQYRLYQSTLAKHRYGGTGGLDGDANLTGVPMPIWFGRNIQVEPTLVNAANLIWQVHLRQMQEITEVRAGGAPLTFTADYGSYDALVAASLSDGYYATCLALGLIKTHALQGYGLRVDGKGDAQGSYVETRGAIARRLATTLGDLPLGDPANIDTTSFSDFDAAQPAPCGLFLRELTGSVGAILDKWMAGCAGWWTMSLTGQMRVDLLQEPDPVPDFTLQYRPDLAGEPVMEDAPPPRLETSIGWRRNWSPQDPSTLAGSVTASNRRLYQDLWSYSDPFYGRNDAIEAQFLAGRRVFVEGYYALQADADAEADRQRALFSQVRRRWQVTVNLDAFTDVLGKTMAFTDVNRLGWGASKSFRVIGIDAIASSETVKVTLWG